MKALLLLAILAISSPAFAQVDTKAQSLITLHKKKFDWLINKKTDSLIRIIDEKVMYIHSNGVVETKAEMIDHLKTGVITYKKIQVDEAKARLYGDTGIVTGKGTFEGKWGENSFAINLSYTEVYVKIKKQWMLVSRAACRVTE
jgi:hypothetical protein